MEHEPSRAEAARSPGGLLLGLHNRFHGTRFCYHNNLRMARPWAVLLAGARN